MRVLVLGIALLVLPFPAMAEPACTRGEREVERFERLLAAIREVGMP
jgi:hypothetical protein